MVIRRRVLSEAYDLPIFDANEPFAHICKDNARIDKFEVRYPNNRLHYINSNIVSAFVQSLSRTVCFAPLGRNANNGVGFSKDVLLSGNKIYFNTRSGGGAGVCQFRIVLNANYNRFYQANFITASDITADYRLEQGGEIYNSEDLLDLFLADNPALAEAKEITLDHKDNVLLRQRWRQAGDVLTLLPVQIRLCQQFIENQFSNTNPNFPLDEAPIENGRVSREYLRQAQVVPIFDWTDFSIPHFEVSWDFRCKNAITVAKSFKHPMEQITTNLKTRYHRYSQETDNNVVSYNARLIDNVSLSAYAKTRTRLRFEIVYSKRSLKSILSTRLRNVRDMRSTIDLVLDDATQKLTKFLRAMHQRQTTPTNVDRAEVLANFLKHIYQSTGGRVSPQQENIFQELLSLIAHSGRIIAMRSHNRLFPMLDYLEQQGILERTNRRQGVSTRTYSFTQNYEWLLRAIME